MVGALQISTVSPGQLASVQPGQLTIAPGVGTSQVGDLLESIMPLIMIMMVMTKIASHPRSSLPRKDSASDGETP